MKMASTSPPLSLYLLLVLITEAALFIGAGSRSFTIDYDANTFLKDGEPFRYRIVIFASVK